MQPRSLCSTDLVSQREEERWLSSEVNVLYEETRLEALLLTYLLTLLCNIKALLSVA